MVVCDSQNVGKKLFCVYFFIPKGERKNMKKELRGCRKTESKKMYAYYAFINYLQMCKIVCKFLSFVPSHSFFHDDDDAADTVHKHVHSESSFPSSLFPFIQRELLLLQYSRDVFNSNKQHPIDESLKFRIERKICCKTFLNCWMERESELNGSCIWIANKLLL